MVGYSNLRHIYAYTRSQFVHITELNWVSQRLLPHATSSFILEFENQNTRCCHIAAEMNVCMARLAFVCGLRVCVDIRARCQVFCNFISFSLRVAHTFHHSFPFWNGACAMHFLVSPYSFTTIEQWSHCVVDSIAFFFSSRFIQVYCWTAAHTSSLSSNQKKKIKMLIMRFSSDEKGPSE